MSLSLTTNKGEKRKMEKLKLGDKMIEVSIVKHNKQWVLCVCPECEGEFIAKLEQTDKSIPDTNNLFGLMPLPEDLTCPYCGVNNDIYAEHFPKVEL